MKIGKIIKILGCCAVTTAVVIDTIVLCDIYTSKKEADVSVVEAATATDMEYAAVETAEPDTYQASEALGIVDDNTINYYPKEAEAEAEEQSYRTVTLLQVIDGNTLYVSNSYAEDVEIKLAGCDAADASFLQSILADYIGRPIYIRTVLTESGIDYDYVYTNSTCEMIDMINYELLVSGNASYNEATGQSDWLEYGETYAQVNNLGIWGN